MGEAASALSDATPRERRESLARLLGTLRAAKDSTAGDSGQQPVQARPDELGPSPAPEEGPEPLRADARRRNAAAALPAARAVLEALPDAVMTVDERGRIVGANAAAYGLFEFEPGELIGCDVRTVLPADVSSLPARARIELFARRKDRALFAVEVVRAELTSTGHRFALLAVRAVAARIA